MRASFLPRTVHVAALSLLTAIGVGGASSAVAQQPTPAERGIVVGLPRAQATTTGELRVEPNVRVATAPRTAALSNNLPPSTEVLPDPPFMQEAIPYRSPSTGTTYEEAEPIFGDVLAGTEPMSFTRPLHRPLERMFGPRSMDAGIGHERLIYAPMEIEVSQPQNQYRFRFDSVQNFHSPDRAEFLFAAPPKGPPAERQVNYQDIRAMFEVGGPAFSVGTEIPIRILDPEFNDNTAGLSDMSVTAKTRLIDGSDFQLTQFFRSYMNTGAFRKGLGTGHVSLEPGVLARYKWSDEFYWHGELRYLFPLGGDPAWQGQVLRYGVGYSHLLYENDSFAILDTMEFVGWTVLDGQQYDFTTMGPQDTDGIGLFSVYPGVRFVRDAGGDLGTCELGLTGAIGLGNSSWYDSMLRVEIRWVY
ncbi:MAG TPA: hypothetical protein VL096_08350 [Pirellulaceae bacterium]|nr:hypothetical protein [Pirellulaceae bacterium]